MDQTKKKHSEKAISFQVEEYKETLKQLGAGKKGKQAKDLLEVLENGKVVISFNDGTCDKKKAKSSDVAHKIDSTVEAFNRISKNNNRVFVHCAMGVSRSATFVIMFIMKKYRIPFEEALDFVRDRRNVVDPNEGF